MLENILGEVEEEFVDNVKNKTSDILEHNKTGVEKLGEELKEIWQTAGEVGKELLEDVEEILGLGHKENHENKTENASLSVDGPKANSSSVAKNYRRGIVNFI